jgi:hypothetical protein
MKKVVPFLILLINLSVYGQLKDPYAVLGSVKNKYSEVKDYVVDATIVVNVTFLNIPEKKAKIYYKYPDKVHVEAQGFALLPKRATSFNPAAFIGDKFTAIYVKKEQWESCNIIDVIKTIPDDPENDVILTTFWIDGKNSQIRKLEVNTKSAGTYQVNLQYNSLPFDLPETLSVVFDMKDMNMPKSMTGEITKKGEAAEIKKPSKGKVSITYSNYRVNIGLDDKIFTKTKL